MKQYKYKINGNTYNVSINDVDDNMAQVEVNGTPYNVELEKKAKPAVKKISRPAAAPTTDAGAPVVSRPAAGGAGGGAIQSPLPGVIVDIRVAVGDTVAKGQTVLILEAMKMENEIHADKDGKVVAINVNKGDSVLEGTDLVVVE